MTDRDSQIVSVKAKSAGDAEALRHLEQSIMGGKHWYIALLEAIGLWGSAGEDLDGRSYRYLIDDEAFDWLLLAERMCAAVDGLLPQEEKDAFLFKGVLPLSLSSREVRELIGDSKYRQYLNYFYGVTVEETLVLVVQEEVHKERQMLGGNNNREITDEAYRRIYGVTRAVLLKRFRQERDYSRRRSITLTELKEFTYWLFKYRLRLCEKAKVASDTRKALTYLQTQWTRKGFRGILVTDGLAAE